MKSFEVVAVLSNCFVQKHVDLSDNIYVIPLPPMEFKGEVDYVISIKDIVGFTAPKEFIEAVNKELENCQQASLLCIKSVVAIDAAEAQRSSIDLIEICCDTLSILCRNRVEPIAIASRDGDIKTWIRMLPPENPRIWHSINAPGFLDIIPRIQEKSVSFPKFALLCRLFRLSQRTKRDDFSIFHCIQLLEVAADEFEGYLAQKLRHFFESIQLHGDLEALPRRLGLEIHDGKDFVNVMVELRNAMAHEGQITKDTVADFVHPFLVNLPALQKEITELVRASLASYAIGGFDKMAMRIEGPASFEVKFW